MVHAGICDDEKCQIEFLTALLTHWAESTGAAIQISAFSSAENFLFHYEDNKNFDILLLDIEMDKINGVELAKKIRRDNDMVQIIFITGYSEYISEGYEVAALHYLVKPVKEEKLLEILDRALQKIKKNEKVLFLELPDEIVRLLACEIRYLEVRQNYVTVHAKTDYTIKKTLREFETELDERFYRMGRSYIVNLSYVTRITKTDVFLSDGSVIPLPRGQYEPLNRAFISNT